MPVWCLSGRGSLAWVCDPASCGRRAQQGWVPCSTASWQLAQRTQVRFEGVVLLHPKPGAGQDQSKHGLMAMYGAYTHTAARHTQRTPSLLTPATGRNTMCAGITRHSAAQHEPQTKQLRLAASGSTLPPHHARIMLMGASKPQSVVYAPYNTDTRAVQECGPREVCLMSMWHEQYSYLSVLCWGTGCNANACIIVRPRMPSKGMWPAAGPAAGPAASRAA